MVNLSYLAHSTSVLNMVRYSEYVIHNQSNTKLLQITDILLGYNLLNRGKYSVTHLQFTGSKFKFSLKM